MPGELPKGDKAVYVFLEMIALGFALGSVDSLMSGKPWYVTTGSLVLGIACFLAGIKWAKIKQKLLVGYINPVE